MPLKLIANSVFGTEDAVAVVADVDTVVCEHGTPWFSRYGLTLEDLSTVRATEGWHARYGSSLGSAKGGAAGKAAPGEVY